MHQSWSKNIDEIDSLTPKEDTERQANSLKDDPGRLSVKLDLIRSCVDLGKKMSEIFNFLPVVSITSQMSPIVLLYKKVKEH